jgi:hypothetical protein
MTSLPGSNAGLPPVDAPLVAEDCGYEIVDGRLVAVPPAHEPHGERHAKVLALLEAASDGVRTRPHPRVPRPHPPGSMDGPRRHLDERGRRVVALSDNATDRRFEPDPQVSADVASPD